MSLLWVPELLQRSDDPRSDPHWPLTLFGLNTHVWTVSRDIGMEKWKRRVESVLLKVPGEVEQDWGVPQLEVTGACESQKKSTWREVCTRWAVGSFPCQKYLGSFPDPKHRTASRSSALPLSLSLPLWSCVRPAASVSRVSDFFAGKFLCGDSAKHLKCPGTVL